MDHHPRKDTKDNSNQQPDGIGDGYVIDTASGLYKPKSRNANECRGEKIQYVKHSSPLDINVRRDWVLIIISVLTLLGLGVTIYFTSLQWKESRKAADASIKSAEAAQNALAEARYSRQHASRDAQYSREVSQTDNRLAMEAIQGQSKAALDASINNSRLDQRPWIVLSRFELSAEPSEGVPFMGTFWMVNSGRTPALNVAPSSIIRTYYQYPEPPMPFSLRPDHPISAGLLAPGGVGDFHFSTERLTLGRAQEVAYAKGTTVVYGQATIEYADAFNNGASHWTTICVTHTHGRPLNEFNFCSAGNDVDHQ